MHPLRRSCVSSARNAGESAICPVRAQPCAEIPLFFLFSHEYGRRLGGCLLHCTLIIALASFALACSLAYFDTCRNKESKTAGERALLCHGRASSRSRKARSERAKRKTEKDTLRERERVEQARACSCAVDGPWALVLLLSICAGLCGLALSSP